jgi:hypothetical protein
LRGKIFRAAAEQQKPFIFWAAFNDQQLFYRLIV